MEIPEVFTLVTTRLPRSYEPLPVTFYGKQSRPNSEYVVIGDNYGTEFRVLLNDGAVFSIDPDGKLPERFVNSSIEQLAKFVEIYASYAERAKSDAETSLLTKRMRDELASLDASAFETPENWWAVVLEQVENGLL